MIEPGMATAWFSMTSTRPTACCSTAIWLARCGLPGSVAISCAVPKPAPAGGGVLVATAAPMTVAASATTMSARTSIC